MLAKLYMYFMKYFYLQCLQLKNKPLSTKTLKLLVLSQWKTLKNIQ